MQRAAGMPDSNEYGLILRPLQYVDYISLDTINVKRCLFLYEYDYPSPYTSLVPCYEFYFNTPMKINQMTDTFYVGREKFFVDGGYYYPSEYSGKYISDPIVSDYWYVGYTDTTRFYNLSIYNERLWGFSFPIIGFHCGPLDEENHSLLLTNVGNNSAVVQWYNGGECGTYNVRLTSYDGTLDTIVVTEDSVCTFTNLPLYKRYTVQVRKQCRYATANYDTTVYGPWTTENPSFVTGEPCTPISDVQATVSGSSAMVTWTGFPHYSSLRLRYGYINQEESQWQEVDVTGDTVYFITGLESGRMYGVSLKAYCDFYEWEMPWSDPVYFYTLDSTGGGTGVITDYQTMLSKNFTLAPNPAHGTAVLTLAEAAEGAELTLCDLGGRELRREQVTGTTHSLDVSALPTGVYLLKLTTPQGVAIRRLLVE